MGHPVCFIYSILSYYIKIGCIRYRWKGTFPEFSEQICFLHTATTKIGKVCLMPLFFAYGNIAYFMRQLSIFHVSKIWIEIFWYIFIFAIKSRLLFQRKLTCSWTCQIAFADIKFLYVAVSSCHVSLVATWFQNKARAVPVKLYLHLNLSWNAEIGSFRQPWCRAPWLNHFTVIHDVTGLWIWFKNRKLHFSYPNLVH